MNNNKVAIVTEGSGGVGRAVALRFGRDDFAVVVNLSAEWQNAGSHHARFESLRLVRTNSVRRIR